VLLQELKLLIMHLIDQPCSSVHSNCLGLRHSSLACPGMSRGIPGAEKSLHTMLKFGRKSLIK